MLLLHFHPEALPATAAICETLTRAGLFCTRAASGVAVSTEREPAADIDRTWPTLAVVCADSDVGAALEDGISDVAVWPRDRLALPFRARSLIDAYAYRVQRDLYRALLDAVPALVIAKTRTGRIVFANKAIARAYGVTQESMLARSSVDVQPQPEARAAIDTAESALFSTRAPQNYDLSMTTVEGSRHFHTNASIIVGPRNEELVAAIAWDVTEQRAAEQRLQRQHYLLRQVLDASPGPITVKDAEGRYLLVNTAFARHVGRSIEEIVGLRRENFIANPSQNDAWTRADERALRARVPLVEELGFARPDAGELRFLCVRSAFEGENGEPCLLTIATDVTARRKAEENAEQYRALVEMSRTLALVTDLNGVILSASRAWLVVFGYPEYALVGTHLCDLVHPDDRQRCGQDSPSLDRLDGAEVRWRASDGRYLVLTWNVAIDAPKGRGYAVAHEITALRAAERAAELARENAVEASRTKSRFLANMSHEVRTPMNGVLGMLEALLETDLSQTQREYLTDAYDSADSLLVILNDILDISKIEAGKLTLETVPFHVREAVNAALTPLFSRAKRKGLSTSVFFDDGVPEFVSGDPVRVRQILVNLVGNAIKFTDQGGVSVTVSTDDGAPDRLRFAVTDTGIGIPAEKRERIFEAFRQADESTTRTYGGTGLGLSICRELTRLMEGSIWVHSKPGCGSTFYFTARLPSSPAATGVDARSEAPAASARKKRLRVLLAEDNLVNTKLAVRLLEKNDCEVTAVPNGQAAVDAVANSDFDVVLMDLQMPVLDGFDATRQIRASESAGHRLPIVALTASAMKDDEQRCLAADMDAHLSKPLEATRIAELLNSIRTGDLLQVSVAKQASAPPPPPVDLRLVKERCDNDRDIFREVVDAYRESCKGGFLELERANVGSDVVAVRRAAHQLRGAFLYVAAGNAARIADQIENSGDTSASSIGRLIDTLKREAVAVEAVLVQETRRETQAPPAA